jgi:hypothetical protein
MLRFLQYVITEAKLSARGQRAQYDANKYIIPHVKGGPLHKPFSHQIESDIGEFKAGDNVTLHSHHVDDRGVHHVVVSKKGSNNKVAIPINKIKKISSAKNKGFEQETTFINRLNKNGLMSGTAAGPTAGNDFHLIDRRPKRKVEKIRGSAGISTPESTISGEHKSNKTAAFGQITVTRHPKTGKWHISDAARANRPEYASHVENATITVNGKKKKLLDHLNDEQPHGYKPPEGRTSAEDIHSDDTSLAPANAYMRDHGVDVLHLDSHGTYRAGNSENVDQHKLGLPKFQGTGRFRVRQKHSPHSRTIQFNIRDLEKSNTNLGTDEGVETLKKTLGHL